MKLLFARNMKQKRGTKTRNLKFQKTRLDVKKTDKAEQMILKLVQKGVFDSDIKVIKNSYLNDTNQQYMNIYIFEYLYYIHPIILQKYSSVSILIARDCHNTVAHGGKSATMQEIRISDYWIINYNNLVRHIIFSCIKFRSMNGKFCEKVMADLPKNQVNEPSPFTHYNIDLFRPFLVKEQ